MRGRERGESGREREGERGRERERGGERWLGSRGRHIANGNSSQTGQLCNYMPCMEGLHMQDMRRTINDKIA